MAGKIDLKKEFNGLLTRGKNIDPSKPLDVQNNVTLKEFIAIGLYKVGTQIYGTTQGSKAATFLYECYYKGVMDSTRVADISAILTTVTTILGLLVGVLAAIVVFKWKSKWGHYRQWFVIPLLPIAVLYALEFVVPAFSATGLIAFQFVVQILKTILAGFYGLAGNYLHVISPNIKEKKLVVTLNQVFYYIGYGLAYLLPVVFGTLPRSEMYFYTVLVGDVILFVGSILCAFWLRERLELPQKKKEKITTTSLKLFKHKNYVAYHLIQWTSLFAMTGKMMTYLSAIVVGTDKAVLLTLPSAIGTGLGVVLATVLSKKLSPVKLLKIAGVYMPVMGLFTFFAVFFTHEFGILFYIAYFLFGLSFGIAELSTGHLDAEFNDFLEWQTGERLEAVQGVIPNWIKTGLTYVRDIMVPYMIAWVGYQTIASDEYDSLMEYMKTLETYDSTCLWILAFALFGVSLSYLFRTVILTFMYDVDGDRKKKMYEELSVMRAKKSVESVEGEAVATKTADA